MTLKEFKAWLDGFDAAIDGSPTPEQWKKIKEKLDTVEVFDFSKYVTPPVYRSPTIVDNTPFYVNPVTC